MDANIEEAIIENADVGVESCYNERLAEFVKYYRSKAETAAILEELGLPRLEVLRTLGSAASTSKAELTSPNKKSEKENVHTAQKSHNPLLNREKKIRRRNHRSGRHNMKWQNGKVDATKTNSHLCNNGTMKLEENDRKVNKVHDLADSLQDELTELVISDRIFNDNNNQSQKIQQTTTQGDSEPQNEIREMMEIQNNLEKLIIEDIPKKEKSVRIRGYPAFIFNDIDRCVIVEDWHSNTLKSHLTSLLLVELSKYGAISQFGTPEKYSSIEHHDMFYVPAYFNTKEAAAKAIEAGSIVIKSNSHRLTKALPLPETSVVARVSGYPDKLKLAELFMECGRIRKIKKFHMGRMSTLVIVFGDAESAERALSSNKELGVTRYVERRGSANNAATTANGTSNTNSKKQKRHRRNNKKPTMPLS